MQRNRGCCHGIGSCLPRAATSELPKLLPIPEAWLRMLPESLGLRFKCLLELKLVQGPLSTSQSPVPDPPAEKRLPGCTGSPEGFPRGDQQNQNHPKKQILHPLKQHG